MRIAYAIAALTLSGCAQLAKTPYITPPLPTPDAWRQGGVPATATPPQERWWQHFGDPALAALVDQALLRNSDLAVAAINVRRARLQAGLTDRNAQPQFSASAGANATRTLRSGDDTTQTSALSAGITQEIDLWGKLSLQREAAQWAAQATEEDRQNVALSLVTGTMRLYWQLAYLNQRLALADESLGYAQKTLAIVRVRQLAGAATALDVLQAEQALANQSADQAQLAYQRQENRNTLAVMLDAPPGTSFSELQQLPDGPYPIVDAGLPIHVLSRRPDLRAAELRLWETLAVGDVSRMNFYPTLTLTGSLGNSSAALLSLLRNPAAALGASLALPFVQWQEMKLNVAMAQADHERAVIVFRQVFFRALGEVDNALSLRQQLAVQARHLELALVTARKAERVAKTQYRAGSVPVKVWLDAQEGYRTASVAAAANRFERLSVHAVLYQVLGGDAAVD